LSIKKLIWLRKSHKWLAFFAGIQILVWSISGLYMTLIDIEIIHGDHLVKIYPSRAISPTKLVPINQSVIEQHPNIQSVTLSQYFDQVVYEVKLKSNQIILDATTGKLKAPLSKEIINQQADQIYAGVASINDIKLLPASPVEIGGSKQPVWKVSYDDWLDSTLYFHPQTGQLVKKRTDLWRIFDFFWILHIMEFAGSSGFEGFLFRFFSITSLLMALFGSGLLYYRLKRGQNP